MEWVGGKGGKKIVRTSGKIATLFPGFENFLSTTSDGIFILKQQTA